MQYVRVEVDEGRAYTYTWDDEVNPPLKPGEIVVLPSNIVQDRAFTGRVIRLMPEPDTDFPLKAILRRAKKKKTPAVATGNEDLL